MSVHLLGGGRDAGPLTRHLAAFLADCPAKAPRVVCVLLDEGDGAEQARRWTAALRAAGTCAPVPVFVRVGERLDPAALADADALFVGGGPTPAYADALAPVAAELRTRLGDRPYAGFSAGAAVAAARAVVGGWRSGGVPVCPEDAAEDLEEVTVVDGLGLVPFTVDVHCAQWGTLPRLLSAVAPGADGVGIDEGTSLVVGNGELRVRGAGSAWWASATARGTVVVTLRDGDRLPLDEIAPRRPAGRPAQSR